MKRTVALIVLSIGLAGCTVAPQQTDLRPPVPTKVPGATPAAAATVESAATVPPTVVEPSEAAPDVAEIRSRIQRTLDRYVEAYNAGDTVALLAVVDPQNAAFRRLVEGRYRYMAEASAGTSTAAMQVETVDDRGGGYWQAHISVGTQRVDWIFRNVDGEWLLSEPLEAEIGERIRIESDHFTLVTYAWAGELNTLVTEQMERAADQVEATLGRRPAERFTLYLRPIFGIRPPVDATALAWYMPGSRPQSDRIDVFAPGSFAYGSYPADGGWQPDLYATLLHEYTHLVYQRSFAQDHRITDWMSEGLAEYVAESPRAGEVAAAVRSGRIIPILAEDGANPPQDLDHLRSLAADNSLAYGLAYSLVAYISETYGGLDGYWRLAAVMRNTGGTGRAFYDEAFRQAFDVDYITFDRGWRAWLAERYR
jgi:hypothetical protein